MSTTVRDHTVTGEFDWHETTEAEPSFARKSQQVIEESIQRNPGLCVGAALAAGVVLGCLVKRN